MAKYIKWAKAAGLIIGTVYLATRIKFLDRDVLGLYTRAEDEYWL